VSNDLGPSLRVIAAQPRQHTVVWDTVLLKLRFPVLRRPCLDHSVVVLVVADGYLWADVVSDGFGLSVEFDQLLGSFGFLLLLVFFQLLLLLEEVVRALLGLLLGPDLLLDRVDGGTD
jgi:hypothetical protein